MKKILFSVFFFSFMVVGAQAQKAACSKTCNKSAATSASCQSKAPSVASSETSIESAVAAAKLASMDASIETKTCPVTGNVSYSRKETCAHSGNVSYVDINYDAASNTFVNVSPMKMEGSSIGTGASTSCSSKATTAGGKSCCAKGGSGKSAEKVKS